MAQAILNKILLEEVKDTQWLYCQKTDSAVFTAHCYQTSSCMCTSKQQNFHKIKTNGTSAIFSGSVSPQ